ncbi:uncharacterized protein LOC111597446 isoform X2 [Drosophila hydei]|uniref:Uncharacterized protein LOC111597446 isoform X2 n=1 Tax=Drosophila hydei TaxID=7224 RepID=A0A6J1LKT1_DROHY|nr:uncharacterized protein LOC111597446 isoform X2 [Drosophila hydei]
MDVLFKYRYSFLAGACAAGGSFFGKLPSFISAMNLVHADTEQPVAGYVYAEFALVQLLPLGLMLFFNICNLRYYLKALQMTQQTLTATVLTAASNYVISVRMNWCSCLSGTVDIIIWRWHRAYISGALFSMRYYKGFKQPGS